MASLSSRVSPITSSKLTKFSERLQKMHASHPYDHSASDSDGEFYGNPYESHFHSTPTPQKPFHKNHLSVESIESPKLMQTIHEYSETLNERNQRDGVNTGHPLASPGQRIVIVSVRFSFPVFGGSKNDITSQGKELLNFALDKLVLPGDRVIVILVVKDEEYFDSKYRKIDEEFKLLLQTWIELGYAKRIAVESLVIFSSSEKVALVSQVISFRASVLLLGASWKNAMNYTKQAETCLKVLPPFCSVMVVKNKTCIFAKRGGLGTEVEQGKSRRSRFKSKNKIGKEESTWKECTPLLEWASGSIESTQTSSSLGNQGFIPRLMSQHDQNCNNFPRSNSLPLPDVPNPPYPNTIKRVNMNYGQDDFSFPHVAPHPEPCVVPFPNHNRQGSAPHNLRNYQNNLYTVQHKTSQDPSKIKSNENFICQKIPLNLDPFHDQELEYHQIAEATQNFARTNLLGDGGCGEVYLGKFANGERIAVKKLKLGFISNGDMDFAHRVKQILTEIFVIRKIHHRNLLELKGWHLSQENCLLVFSYLPNGSLEKRLKDTLSPPLTWDERIKIALTSAEGIKYLHEFCRPPIIHCDIKSANILLDANLEAQVADFGLARLLPEGIHHSQGFLVSSIVGTNGYLSPDYVRTGVVDDKVDVFAYGVVLFELLSSKAPYDDQRRPRYLFDWGRQKAMTDKFDEIADPRLGTHYNKAQFREMMKIATLCTSDNPVDRPTMNEIVRWLEQICGGSMRRKQDRIYAP